MFAVIRSGGKQYRVAEGDHLQVEKLTGKAGDAVTFDDVLLVADKGKTKVGKPVVKGAKVKAEILAQGRDDKIVVFRMRRRTNHRRKQGHRQSFTEVKITAITG